MVSFPWYSSAAQSSQTSKPEPKPKPELEPKSEPSLKALWEQSREWLGQQPVERVVGITCLSIIGWRVGVRLLRRYPNAMSITQEMIRSKRWIKGKVVDVNDPDGFRIYHIPPLHFFSVPNRRNQLKDRVIVIRLAGIDAPEYGYWGKPRQAFADEAIAHLKKLIYGKNGKIVYVQLLAHDRFGRMVAVPKVKQWWHPLWLTPWLGKHVCFDMLRNGWAVVYDRKDAVYGKWGKAKYDKIEAKAKEKRIGQWVNGPDIETPAEYKRKYSGIVSDSKTDVEIKPLSNTKISEPKE